MAPTEYRIAESVRVVRDPNSPTVKLFIDGEEFPCLFTADGIETRTPVGEPGYVQVRLLARSITVEDRMLRDAEIAAHTHDDEAPV